jgi:hypothetical protein
MESISLQLTDSHCKLVQNCAYTVPSSVEKQLHQKMEISRLVDIAVIKEDYSLAWPFPTFAIYSSKR